MNRALPDTPRLPRPGAEQPHPVPVRQGRRAPRSATKARRRVLRSAEKARRSERLAVRGSARQARRRLRGSRRGRSALATAQGLYLLFTGVWPLVHYRSFELVSGPKKDDWLVKCVGGLAATMGYALLRSDGTDAGRASARRIGIGASATFGAIDVVYGGGGRISRIYLLDAVVELAWLAAWLKVGRRRGRDGRKAPGAPPEPGMPRAAVPQPTAGLHPAA